MHEGFLTYCSRGKLQEVIECISTDVSVLTYQDENGCTGLHAAAAAGQLEVVQCICEQSMTMISIVDDLEQNALFYAAFHGHVEVVQVLVEAGIEIVVPDKLGRLVHCAGAINGHLDVVRYLLEEMEHPININAIDEYGGTCLHWAALKGRKEVVQYLCHMGMDVHVKSYDNRTALQLAKDKHKHKCVSFLKAWLELLTTFIRAAEEGNIVDLERIIAEVNKAYPLRHLRDKDGRSALNWAAASGHLDSMKILADHFDTLTDVDKYGRNALHWAALGGHKACVRWLVSKGKDTTLVRTLTLTNKSPSRCAFEAGHPSIAAQLQAVEEGHEEAEVDEVVIDPIVEPVVKIKSESVTAWLESFHLEEYATHFSTDGFDTLRGVATIDEKDLVDMQVKKGHRRVFISNIEVLKLQLGQYDEVAMSTGLDLERDPSFGQLPALPKSIYPRATTPPPPAASPATSVSSEPVAAIAPTTSPSALVTPNDGSIASNPAVVSVPLAAAPAEPVAHELAAGVILPSATTPVTLEHHATIARRATTPSAGVTLPRATTPSALPTPVGLASSESVTATASAVATFSTGTAPSALAYPATSVSSEPAGVTLPPVASPVSSVSSDPVAATAFIDPNSK